MRDTRLSLPKPAKKKLVDLLTARLADCLDLYGQAKHAHWNVSGPQFIALHELFDKVAGEVDGYADDLAERAVQLGGVASGRASDVAKNTALMPYPAGEIDGTEHVVALADALAAFGKLTREAIDAATALGDADTADLFTGISRGVDKQTWFVEAHLR